MVDGLQNISLLAQEAAGAVPDASHFFSGLDSDVRAGLLFASLAAVTAIVITLWCVAWNFGYSMHRQRLEADLKRDMLDRGMSADEIAKVIECAAPPEGGVDRWIASWGKKKA